MSSRSRKTENDIDVSLESFAGSRVALSIVFFVLLLIPFVGMLWAPTNETVENRELASAPSFVNEEGLFNYKVLPDAGAYFDDHYAYRTKLIDAGAHLYASLFGISTADTVVDGTDGWLYYAGTLGDYQDTKPLRAAEANNIAHNIKLIQDICEERSAKFAFAIAPNKNSLYGGNMPYYRPRVESDNMNLLNEALDRFNVNSVDLYGTIASRDERLYFYRDSHWTEKGALYGQNAIAKAAGFKVLGLSPERMSVSCDYTGDLASMLFPDSPDPEDNWYFEGINDGSGVTGTIRSGSLWNFIEGESVEDSNIKTEPAPIDAADEAFKDIKATSQKNGKLLMFRDSFGNSLVPYLACEFESATFSKMLPMNLLLLDEEEPDTVLIERAQRHVSYFAEEAPLVVSPIADDVPEPESEAEGADVEFEISTNGPLGIVKGFIEGDAGIEADDEVYLRLIDEDGLSDTYRAFALSDAESGNDNGFCVNVDLDLWANQSISCEVLLGTDDGTRLLATFEFSFNEQD